MNERGLHSAILAGWSAAQHATAVKSRRHLRQLHRELQNAFKNKLIHFFCRNVNIKVGECLQRIRCGVADMTHNRGFAYCKLIDCSP
jgi:hypothetical protein